MKSEYKNRLRTWVEIDKKAIFHNIAAFRRIIKPKVKLMAVVKSNAYGYGLADFAKTSENKVDWFGVDSITEGLKLRQIGLKKPILVLGYTLPSRLVEAAKNNIDLTVSSFESLSGLAKLKNRPVVQLKVDTGMHRQGFFLKDLPKIAKFLKQFKLFPEGIYTHLAAKDELHRDYALKQIETFKKADKVLKLYFNKQNYLRHVVDSVGSVIYPEAHFDMIRTGIGLYGIFPAKELEIQAGINLRPALTWKSIIGEIKKIPKNSRLGYDLTEEVLNPSKIAIVPVGYWHGFDRGLSSIGEVLINGSRCKVLGRVNMDIIMVDVTKCKNPKVNDEVVLIGKSGSEKITAEELARKINTIGHEIITRINPLIKRFYK